MARFGANHYVPVLMWKQGEQAALAAVAVAAKQFFTPVIDVPEIPVDLGSGIQTRSLADHVNSAINAVVAGWGHGADFFLDSSSISQELHPSGISGSRHLYESATVQGLPFIPILRLGGPIELAAAAGLAPRGVAIRVTGADVGDANFATNITNLATQSGKSLSEIDLLVDLGDVASMVPLAIQAFIVQAVHRVPSVHSWRTLTVIVTSFPNLSGMQGAIDLPRTCWQAWRSIVPAAVPRFPTFGDYGIQSAEGVDGYDPRFMPMSPSVRYTLGSRWLVIRGRSSRVQRLTIQFPQLAAQLVADSRYMGAAHCDGCADSSSCANGAAGFGSPTVWRRIGTCHHLMLTSTLVSALPPVP